MIYCSVMILDDNYEKGGCRFNNVLNLLTLLDATAPFSMCMFT